MRVHVVDTTNQAHLARLHKEYESVCQACLATIDSIKVSGGYAMVQAHCKA